MLTKVIRNILAEYHEKGLLGSRFDPQEAQCLSYGIASIVLTLTGIGLSNEAFKIVLNDGELDEDTALKLSGVMSIMTVVERFEELHKHEHQLHEAQSSETDLSEELKDMLKKNFGGRRGFNPN